MSKLELAEKYFEKCQSKKLDYKSAPRFLDEELKNETEDVQYAIEIYVRYILRDVEIKAMLDALYNNELEIIEDDSVPNEEKGEKLSKKEVIRIVAQRLKDDTSSSRKYLTNLSNESLRETALYQNYKVSVDANEEILKLLTGVFDIELKKHKKQQGIAAF